VTSRSPPPFTQTLLKKLWGSASVAPSPQTAVSTGRVDRGPIRRQIPSPSSRTRPHSKHPPRPCGKKKSPQNPPILAIGVNVAGRVFSPLAPMRVASAGHSPPQRDPKRLRANHRRRQPVNWCCLNSDSDHISG